MKIIVLDAHTLDHFDEFVKELNQFEFNLYEMNNKLEGIKPSDFDAQVIFTNKVPLSDEDLKPFTSLKYIQVMATGTDHINVNKIPVKNVRGYATQSVAELGVSFALWAVHGLSLYKEYYQNKEYKLQKSFTHSLKNFNNFSSYHWVIVGMGEIGRTQAQLAKSLGFKVSWYSTSGRQDVYENFDRIDSLTHVFEEADIVSLHCSLNHKTLNLITKDLLTRPLILLNLARGAIVKEDAIIKLLGMGGFYATDVLNEEPLSQQSLLVEHLNNPRLLITPHLAFRSLESQRTLKEVMKANLFEC